MTTYIALLRAVNLGPHNKIGMSDLRQLLTHLGMHGVQTLLQSGNAVFQSDARSASQIEGLIEGAMDPDGIGRSKLTSALIEKKLGARGTGRNWNRVLKLDALADSMP